MSKKNDLKVVRFEDAISNSSLRWDDDDDDDIIWWNGIFIKEIDFNAMLTK